MIINAKKAHELSSKQGHASLSTERKRQLEKRTAEVIEEGIRACSFSASIVVAYNEERSYVYYLLLKKSYKLSCVPYNCMIKIIIEWKVL